MPADRLDKCDRGLITFEFSKKDCRKESGCLDSNQDFSSEPFFENAQIKSSFF